MSLKQFTKDIFTRYGFTEDDINVYITFLRIPRATISEVFMSLEQEHEIEFQRVEEITDDLIQKGFLKKIEGVVNRYIPLEPFFELITNESAVFRNEIGKIKDDILADQSNRFESLEAIQDKSIGEVEKAVEDQTNAFFQDSDAKNASKKERIDNATKRFSDTAKALESDLHENIEKDYSELTADTEKLETELKSIKNAQNSSTKTLESNTHNLLDSLNSDLKNISQAFVSDNESEINSKKDNLVILIGDLLQDFSQRVEKLDKELKKDLDEHVERHKSISGDLKPRMEQILEKYLERMNKVVADLKEKISRILKEHMSHVKSTTDTLQMDLKVLVEERHMKLTEQTNDFKNNTVTLINNLLEHANRFTDFTEDMAKKGFFWAGKKKKYKARHEITIADVLKYSEPLKPGFIAATEGYIKDTRDTTEQIKTDVTNVMEKENADLGTESTDLDKKAQETIDAQLTTLATDMASEIDTTLQGGVNDCDETTIKLKDSLEKSLTTHHTQYDDAINKHKEGSLKNYTDFDSEIKRKNETWTKDVDLKFTNTKNDITTEATSQVSAIDNYKAKHDNTVKERLNKIRNDFNASRLKTTEKIDAEINLWNAESADMDGNLTNMLEDHKTKYEGNAKTLQGSLSTTTRDTIQNVKDAIADFTLRFMNSIDDATELGETSEEKFKDIQKAASDIPEIATVSTWPNVGRDALIASIKDAIYRVKSSIIIVTPQVEPDILQVISQYAFKKKSVRFMLTSHWDLQAYGHIINKMKVLGNIQFRQLSTPGEFYAVTRDAEEVILAPFTDKEGDLISIVSNQEGYSKLYSQFIGPIFLANSRPLK